MKRRLEFVSYDGAYPGLCYGTLVLKEGDKLWEFESGALRSGGCAYFTDDYSASHIEEGDWSIERFPEGFPEELEEEAVRVVNENVLRGCCGGCL